ncbi:MAG: hypothetical protein IT357_06470 [Gemmatimonadaceae bacterium]|nr:hypothetical protein [Gemmatimonadaceae bacterium]
MNLYGYAGGDPINYSDPFGLCKTEAGDDRPCAVHWVGGSRGQPSEAAMAHAQRLAERADVDLYISDGNRDPATDCSQGGRTPASRHNCGLAYDIAAIGIDGAVLDFGTDYVGANPAALQGAMRVQAAALGMHDTREVFGPAGLFRNSTSGTTSVSWERTRSASDWVLSWGHKGHVHVSLQTP